MSDVHFANDHLSADPDPQAVSHEPRPAPKLSIVALRERKKDQTREALARAAFELFRSKGYEATTVAEIARAADVSRRTFFRYYTTKDALLFVDNGIRLERFEALLASQDSDTDGFAHVRRACLALAEDYMSRREQILARARIIESSPALCKQERQQDMLWEAAIAESLLANRRVPTPVAKRRARVIAGAVFGAMRATIDEWRELDGNSDLPRLMREALEVIDPRLLEGDRLNTAAN